MSISRSDLYLSFKDLSPFLQIINAYSSEADMVAHTYNPSVWEVKVGGSGVQAHTWLHSKFEVGLGYI